MSTLKLLAVTTTHQLFKRHSIYGHQRAQFHDTDVNAASDTIRTVSKKPT